MNKWGRVLLAILSLGFAIMFIFLLSAFTPLPLFSSFMAGQIESAGGFRTFCAIFLVLCFVLSLAVLFFGVLFPVNQNFYTIKRDKGDIQISQQSIASMAGEKLRKSPDIKRYHVRVKNNPNQNLLALVLQLEVLNDADFTQMSETIQEELAEDFQNILGIQPNHISFQFYPYEKGLESSKEESPSRHRVH